MRIDALTLLCTLAAAGCAPIPMQVYVPEVPGGTLVHSSCAFNSHVPVGIDVRSSGIDAIVSLAARDGRDYVEVRFDVPEGKTVALRDAGVRVETSNPASSSRSEFALVSLVDSPIVNNASAVPAVRAQHLPIMSPLVGGRIDMGSGSSPRHFWLATHVETATARDIWIRLPEFTVNGIPASLPPIHFLRRTELAIALINC